MDPVTAIGFAASILQFVDFSWSLLTGTYEVYKSASGTTAQNAHINTVIQDLHEVTEGLDLDVRAKSKHEKALKALASECKKLSKELLQLLEKLKTGEKSSTWKSLKVKLASMLKAKEVANLEKRLGEYRSQILLRINIMLR
jgi:hypothetical protein